MKVGNDTYVSICQQWSCSMKLQEHICRATVGILSEMVRTFNKNESLPFIMQLHVTK